MEKILETNNLMTETMTPSILITRFQAGEKTLPTYPGWGPEGPVCRRNGQEEERRMTPTLHPFARPGLTAFIHLLSNIMRSKRFLSDLIFTLS